MTIEEYMEKMTEELPDGYFFGVSEDDRRIIAVRRPTTEDWLDDLDDRSKEGE
tara:strand:- start:3443 stop:3601 length:159 start_codon:yes stop_codon:yes gene_type:complete